MLAVTTRPRLAFGNGQHGFHRNHHAGFQHSVDVFAQFKASFTAIIMRQNPERVAIAKGAVLQHLMLFKEGVQLGGYF